MLFAKRKEIFENNGEKVAFGLIFELMRGQTRSRRRRRRRIIGQLFEFFRGKKRRRRRRSKSIGCWRAGIRKWQSRAREGRQ